MRITPLDVRKQEFRKVMRGLDADEVYAFLSTMADEYEAALNDNKALRERLLELDDKVQEYRTIERTLRDTLLTAERVTVESKDNARREASLIVKEAQLQADRALRDITSDATRLRQEVQRLRSQRDAYLAKMKVVAESHVKFIESAERDFRAEDEVPAEAPASPRIDREPFPVPEATPRATSLFEAVPPGPGTDVMPGINDILERLSQGQRDAMAATQKIEPVPPPAAPRPDAQTSTEWNMDQIRRDLQNIVGHPHDGPAR